MTALLLLPLCLFNCPPLTAHLLLLLLYLSVSGASRRSPPASCPFACVHKDFRAFSLLYRVFLPASRRLSQTHRPPPSFLLCVQRVERLGDLAPAHREEEEEEEAGLRSVLSGEVEQPLAQQGVVLFQVLDQVGLFLHHLVQVGALSVTQTTRIPINLRRLLKHTTEGGKPFFNTTKTEWEFYLESIQSKRFSEPIT